jgi:hypothetical protein
MIFRAAGLEGKSGARVANVAQKGDLGENVQVGKKERLGFVRY